MFFVSLADGNKMRKKILCGQLRYAVARFLFASAVAAVMSGCRSATGDVRKKPSIAFIEQANQEAQTPEFKYVNHTIRSGETFARIFSHHRIDPALARLYHQSLKPIGFKALYPGDSLILTIDQNAQCAGISLLSKRQNWFKIKHDSTRLLAEKRPVTLVRQVHIARGTLESSLSESMWAIGLGDALVAKLTDIFAWDINFFMDPRKGDSFEIIFERIYAQGQFIGYGNILAARYVNADKEFFAVGMPGEDGRLSYYDLSGKSVQKQFLKAPLRFNRISSGFSYSRRHPILGVYRPHLGIDYAAPTGTPVYSAADGVVSFAGWKGGYGKHIRIRHGASYQTYYGHLHRIAVAPGAHVTQGQYIATVGKTGLATGPHLDYRMKIGSRFVNPRTVSLPACEGVPEAQLGHYFTLRQRALCILTQRFTDETGSFVLSIVEDDRTAERTRHITLLNPPMHVRQQGPS
ncbi:MAG: peptidoglycan DD-metalloendopeptidase family protein [Chitinivibrionales bacterium]|nr:peptidoglycan DD-metalloendopeptidase family protein [Chitinivibrionales bacterium]